MNYIETIICLVIAATVTVGSIAAGNNIKKQICDKLTNNDSISVIDFINID